MRESIYVLRCDFLCIKGTQSERTQSREVRESMLFPFSWHISQTQSFQENRYFIILGLRSLEAVGIAHWPPHSLKCQNSCRQIDRQTHRPSTVNPRCMRMPTDTVCCLLSNKPHIKRRRVSTLTSLSSPAPGAFRTLPSAQWHMFGVCRDHYWLLVCLWLYVRFFSHKHQLSSYFHVRICSW